MFGKSVQKVISSCWLYLQKTRTFQTGCVNMDNAYIRHLKDEERFQLSLQFRNPAMGISRQFNFNRQTSETISDLLERMNISFNKKLTKTKKKLKKTNPVLAKQMPEVQVEFFEDGVLIPGDTICKDILSKLDDIIYNTNLCLKILGVDYPVVINSPWVDSASLPTSIMAKYPVYAVKLRLSFVTREHCLFSWSKSPASNISKDDNAWTDVGHGFVYEPSTSDIGHLLKVTIIPVMGPHHGPSYEVISKGVVESGPGECPYQQRHAFTSERLQGGHFRVVSYNILADLYADSETARTELFPYCPPYALNIDYRKQLILKELIGYNADIMCLQEVDSKIFDMDLKPVLSAFGYLGVHHTKNGEISEGLACMFHAGKFTLVESRNIYLADELPTNPLFSDLWAKVCNNELFVARFKDRTTSVQVTVLDSVIFPSERLVIGNTHLYFHPNADHIRLLQAGMAIRFLEEVVSASKCGKKRVSVVLCGDFNSTPEFGVFRLITSQCIPQDYSDWSSKNEEAIPGVSLEHTLQLASACGKPTFTNYTSGFVGCLDYIFYQHNHLEVKQVIPLPSVEEVTLHTALPSVVFPSDHLALVCDLSLIAP